MAPRTPLPITRSSTSRMGVTSAAVPVRKHSSALYSSSRVIGCSTTSMPLSRAIRTTASRVMPSRIVPRGGVFRVPSRTRNTFSPRASLTRPVVSSMMASS